MSESTGTSVRLTKDERNVNALRALAKLLPLVGDSLDQLAFGPIDELRAKRVEQTLVEIDLRLASLGQQSARAEELASLLEKNIPRIARATSEDARSRFRDLLINAAPIQANDSRWSQAELAGEILAELAPAAMAILAQLAARGKRTVSWIVSSPSPQVVPEGFDWDNPEMGNLPIGYAWPVVSEWVTRLREKRLIGLGSSDARGGFGAVQLTELGEMLVDWTVAEKGDTS